MTVKKCSDCGTNKTIITKRGYEQWFTGPDGKGSYRCVNCHSRHKRRLRGIKPRTTLGYVCYSCGSETTSMRTKENGKQYPNWHLNRPTPFKLCAHCFQTLITTTESNPEYWRAYHKKHNAKQHPKRILFKGKRVILSRPPRIGVCNLCRAVVPFDTKRTHMHHEEYDDIDPLAHTLEVCVSCHIIISWQLKQYPGRNETREQCIRCKSTNTRKAGTAVVRKLLYKKYICYDCRKHFLKLIDERQSRL